VVRKIDIGSALSGVGAALLLVSLFLNWFEPGLTAWEVFEIIDLLLAGISICVLVLAAGDLGGSESDSVKRSLVGLGMAAVVLVGSQLINHPPAAFHSALMSGAWLGLVGAVAILSGSVMSVSRITFAINISQRLQRSAQPDRSGEPDTKDWPAQPDQSTGEPTSSSQVAQAESEIAGELYPEPDRQGRPIGSSDPETSRAEKRERDS
jgi:hypothetical protein